MKLFPSKTAIDKAWGSYNLANSLYTQSKTVRNWWVNNHTYSVSVSAGEPFYMAVREWLTTLIPKVDLRAIGLITVGDNRLATVHDSDKPQSFKFNGHKISVAIDKPSSLGDILAEEISDNKRPGIKKEQIVLTTYSKTGQEALLQELQRIQVVNSKKKRAPQINTMDTWGHWSDYRPLIPRTLESVALVDGQMDRIIEDMRRFLASEADYNRLGIPYHRGYLFQGPPGTGKTSLAKLLAYNLGLDLWYMPLGSISSDSTLMAKVNSIGKGILLMEDVDVFSGMKDREDKQKNTFTLSGLLNVLDGVTTPHGLITIMTTNDEKSLDPAILRPGRIDLNELLDNLVAGQGERIFRSFYGRWPATDLGFVGKAPSMLMDVFKQHMHDPEAAEKACLAQLEVENV